MGLTHLLDTDICIYIIRSKLARILSRFQEMNPGEIGVSSITVSELQFGVEKSSNPDHNRNALAHFLLPLEIPPYDEAASLHYGIIRKHLEARGTPIGPLDTLIAAHARSLGAVLVTHNHSEFQRVPGLRIENW